MAHYGRYSLGIRQASRWDRDGRGSSPCCCRLSDSARLPFYERSSGRGLVRLRKMSKSIVRLLIGIAALAMLLAGCSDEPTPSPVAKILPSSTATPTLSQTPTPSPLPTPRATATATNDASGLPPEGPFLRLMNLIPLNEESRAFVSFNDYTLAREANGIQAPAEDASDEDLEEYLFELFISLDTPTGLAEGPWISGFSWNAIRQLKPSDYLGFDIGDVEQSIWAGELPWILEAASGRFDPEATKSSLSRCTECEEPEIHEHSGIKFYSWGEDDEVDFKKSFQPPAFDIVGRGGRIAVLDSLVIRTRETEGMRSLIDTYRDDRDSLADDPDLALAAGELQSIGVYSAILFGDVERFTTDPLDSLLSAEERAQLEKARAELGMEAEDTPDYYSALGTGVAKDSDGFLTILVFVYEDEDVANRNVQGLEEMLANGQSIATGQPWTEYFPQSEVWSDGRALIARLRTEFPSIWQSIVSRNENLLMPKTATAPVPTNTPTSGPTDTVESTPGSAQSPTNAFASVSAGGAHTCLVKADGSVECWGDNEFGQATPPGGSFASVSAGFFHTCGVKTDGSVECWGLNEDDDGNVVGQATPPGGSFALVSAGGGHTCGVKMDGSVECWGLSRILQATPP